MRHAVVLLLRIAAGCGGGEPVPKPAPPAKVANPVTEAQLATVTLSEEAERRLGVETATAAVENVLRTRTVGGEVMSPPGKHIGVTAPIAGTTRGPVWTAGAASRRGRRSSRSSRCGDLPQERDFGIEAQREAASASAELKAADARLARLEQLLKEGATSARSVEEARAQRDVIAARLTAARARVSSLAAGTVGQSGEIAIPRRSPESCRRSRRNRARRSPPARRCLPSRRSIPSGSARPSTSASATSWIRRSRP